MTQSVEPMLNARPIAMRAVETETTPLPWPVAGALILGMSVVCWSAIIMTAMRLL